MDPQFGKKISKLKLTFYMENSLQQTKKAKKLLKEIYIFS